MKGRPLMLSAPPATTTSVVAEADRVGGRALMALEARAAGHVHRPGRHTHRNPGANADLTSHVRTAPGLATVPKNQLAHLGRVDLRALQEIADHRGPEIGGGQFAEGAEELADRGSQSVGNDDRAGGVLAGGDHVESCSAGLRGGLKGVQAASEQALEGALEGCWTPLAGDEGQIR